MLPWEKDYNLPFDRIDSTNDEALRLAKSRVNGNFIIATKLKLTVGVLKVNPGNLLSGNLHIMSILLHHVNINRTKIIFSYCYCVLETILEFIDKLKAPKPILN